MGGDFIQNRTNHAIGSTFRSKAAAAKRGPSGGSKILGGVGVFGESNRGYGNVPGSNRGILVSGGLKQGVTGKGNSLGLNLDVGGRHGVHGDDNVQYEFN